MPVTYAESALDARSTYAGASSSGWAGRTTSLRAECARDDNARSGNQRRLLREEPDARLLSEEPDARLLREDELVLRFAVLFEREGFDLECDADFEREELLRLEALLRCVLVLLLLLFVPRFALVEPLLLLRLFAVFGGGTLPPSRRASESPIAIACLGLVTFLPELPLRNVPRLRSCIALATLSDAFLPYLAMAASCGSKRNAKCLFRVTASIRPRPGQGYKTGSETRVGGVAGSRPGVVWKW